MRDINLQLTPTFSEKKSQFQLKLSKLRVSPWDTLPFMSKSLLWRLCGHEGFIHSTRVHGP